MHIHAHTHRNTHTSLRPQHLPLSKPAVFNINYQQDISTLCMYTNNQVQ